MCAASIGKLPTRDLNAVSAGDEITHSPLMGTSQFPRTPQFWEIGSASALQYVPSVWLAGKLNFKHNCMASLKKQGPSTESHSLHVLGVEAIGSAVR